MRFGDCAANVPDKTHVTCRRTGAGASSLHVRVAHGFAARASNGYPGNSDGSCTGIGARGFMMSFHTVSSLAGMFGSNRQSDGKRK